MGSGIAMAGLAQGLAQGLKLGSDLQDAEERRSLLREQNERDKTRFKFEQEEMSDKSRRRTMLAEGEKEYADADSLFASGGILNSKQSSAPQQAIVKPATESTDAATPVAQQPAGAPAPRAAISSPGAAPAVAAPTADAQAKPNPFRMDGEGKYQDMNAAWDRYYEMKGNALSKMLMAQGNYKEALQVPKMMRELRDNNWSEKVGASLAAMAGNAPGARDAFAKVYNNINDGWDLDPTKGKYDPEKGWVGLERVNKDGKRESFNMTPEQAAMVSMKYKDPGEVIRFMLDRGDKARQEKREDIKVANDTTRANAASAEVAIKKPYYEAYANRLNAQTDIERSGANQRSTIDAVNKMFPGAFKEYKIEDAATYGGKEGLAKKVAERDTMLKQRDAVLDLVGLNPKINPSTLRSIVMQGEIKNPQTDTDGRLYVMHGKDKIFLQ